MNEIDDFLECLKITFIDMIAKLKQMFQKQKESSLG
jgi:hypothetical protein